MHNHSHLADSSPKDNSLSPDTNNNLVSIKHKKTWKTFVKNKMSKLVSKKWIISHKNKKKQVWDLMILFFATLNTIFVPLMIAFEPPELQTTLFTVFDIIVEIIFIIDIILMFMTSFVNARGQ